MKNWATLARTGDTGCGPCDRKLSGLNACRARVFFLALAFLGATTVVRANVGRTPGAFDVSPDGAATYTIPIFAPRGPNNLEPHVALVYSSQSENGYVGVGWGLAGLSSISRCGKTYAQDGQASPVQLQVSDGYCMDGQRLRVTSGASSYGLAGSTYQTEVADFSLVTAEGSAGNGPGYWEVQGKDGLTYEYGRGGSSQVLANGTSTAWQWWLDKITDRAGNTLTISYSTANAIGTVVPHVISWTPTGYGSTSYAYTMTFSYGTNTPQSSIAGYVAGTTVSDTNLLQTITIAYNLATVKQYSLGYGASPNTQKEELASVTECASSTSNCLAPTTFNYYQDSASGVSTSATTVDLGNTVTWWLAGYDLTGSGYRDLLYQVAGTWYVAFGTASGYGSPISTGITTASYGPGKATTLVGDLLGTGQDGILTNNGGNWWYYTWNGSAFSGVNTKLPYNSSATAFALVDTSGDGLPNLVELVLNPPGLGVQAALYVVPNTSSGGTPSFGSPVLAYTNNDNPGYSISNATMRNQDWQHAAPIRRIDFDGDGAEDLMLHLTFYDSADKIHIPETDLLLSRGTAFNAFQTPYSTSYFFLNWNDSRCTDFAANGTLYVSACNGSPGASYALPGPILAAIDWDDNGRQDLLYDSGGYLYVQPSTGTGLGTPYSTGIPYNSSAQYGSADIVGDGMEDLLTYTNTSSFQENMHIGQGGQPIDTLSQVADGYGNWIKPSYVSLVQGSGSTYTTVGRYAIGRNDELFYGPMDVVSQVTYSDPASPPNGTYTLAHYYDSAAMSTIGYGFAGFHLHQIHDSRNGLWQSFYYQQQFPGTGFITSADISADQKVSSLIRALTNSPAIAYLDTTTYNSRYFFYNSKATLQNYETGGPESGELINTTTTSYNYGGDIYGNPLSITKTVTDNDPGSPYTGSTWTTAVSNTPDENPSSWCLTLLSASQVTYSASDASGDVTRTRQYTPDTQNCRYNGVTTEPSSTTYEVSEQFAYDSFGNVKTDTVTGINMPARVTSTNWGTTGQFPMSITDPTQETTQFNYDFHYGLVSSATDPNNLTTSWQYNEGFGRVTLESRPDGTTTSRSYSTYSGSDLRPRMVVTIQPHDTSGNIVTTTTNYLDMLDRPYIEDRTSINGSTATIVDRTYDSLGRLASEEMPYEGSPIGAKSYSYDALNRVVQTQRPISATDSRPATTSYAYEGDTTTITDANGHMKTLLHDPNGWLRKIEDATGYAVTMGYDAAGSHTGTSDSLGNTLWSGTVAYGVAPYTVASTDADLGAWQYTFDALGELTAWVDAKGQSFSAKYDALSRMTDRYEPDMYTHWAWGTSAAAHEIGQLHSVCTGTGTSPSACSSSGYSESETYDSAGRAYQRSIVIPNDTTYTYTQTYNADGLPDTLKYPVSTASYALSLKYGYAYGLPTSITDVSDSPNVTLWTANTMNPRGQVTAETLGNGVVVNHAFDGVTGLPSSITAGLGGGTALQNNSYLFDAVGNLTQRQDNKVGTTESAYYDALNRLTYTVGDSNTHLTYDAMGRLETWGAYGNSTNTKDYTTWQSGCAYYSNAQPHAVRSNTQGSYAPDSFCYDANGNMTTDINSGTTMGSYSWTSFNQPNDLVAPTVNSSSRFFYDQNHQRYEQVASYSGSPETTEYIGGSMEKMTNSSGTSYRYYVPAGNNFIVYNRWTNGTNALDYITKDNIGSSAVVTDHAGALVVTEQYAALGWNENGTVAPLAGITRHRFTGQEDLDTPGLWMVDMNGRVYQPSGGMFLSPDPNIFQPDNTQDYDRYSYVHNNPLTYVDPSGFGCSLFFGNDLFGQMVQVGGEIIGISFFSDGGGGGAGAVCGGGGDGGELNERGGGGGGGHGNGGNSAAQQATAIQSFGEIEIRGSRIPRASATPRFIALQNQAALDALLLGTISIDFAQQSNPNHGQCPKPGFWSNVGNALTNFGSDVHGAGTEASRIGAVTAVVGAGATLVQPEIGAPVLFAGGVFIGVGKLGEGVGTVLSLAGGAILAVEGNSQPFQSAAVDMAQSQFDDNIHLPPGVPSPAQPVADAMSGENPCP